MRVRRAVVFLAVLASLSILSDVRVPACARARLTVPWAAGECGNTCLDICQTNGTDLVSACSCQCGDGPPECACACSDTPGTHVCEDFPGCETVYNASEAAH